MKNNNQINDQPTSVYKTWTTKVSNVNINGAAQRSRRVSVFSANCSQATKVMVPHTVADPSAFAPANCSRMPLFRIVFGANNVARVTGTWLMNVVNRPAASTASDVLSTPPSAAWGNKRSSETYICPMCRRYVLKATPMLGSVSSQFKFHNLFKGASIKVAS